MMRLIGKNLDFRFYFFSKQQFKASLEQFYTFNYAAERQHEQIKSHTVSLAATEDQSSADRSKHVLFQIESCSSFFEARWFDGGYSIGITE